ncbi:fibroblast growth factor receptor-like 1 [Aplysia californica]|uniref:Fibroblast growth factor receptor-like 1 n=1 Tax=Aplysia californica TaxID=6500 RepID=A0ABM0JBQ1_APLCA|nr:fibroblast growth factor receptor-like 1 [Aplysia californica]XP_005089978.1 fibroblast growth factor receptor-like 1 [Aplysia californica]XP_005089979.1 fibroblast growth factor receptor-like 1 [Aplysia californica]
MAGLRCWGALLVLQVVALCHANSPPSLSGTVVSRKVATLGKTTRLECPVDGQDPELTVWKKNGQSIDPAWERFRVSREGHLRIRHTEMGDAGNYTCVATNGYGSLPVNYTVVVRDEDNGIVQEGNTQFKLSPHEDLYKAGSAPYFEELDRMKESMNMIKPTGSNVRLRCAVNGNPRPVVHWLKNGRPYEHRDLHSLLKVHEIKENASYTCVASNRLGQVNFTYNVGVVGEIRKPRLTAPHPLSQTVAVGKSVSFQCFIESVVEPQVQWLKRVDKPEDIPHPNVSSVQYEGVKFVVLKNAGVLLALPDGSFLNKLVLQNVQPKDAGMFVCLATNRMGFNSRHAFLNIASGAGFDPNNGNARISGNQYTNLQDSGSGDSSQDSSDSHDSSDDTNLPLLIGLPSCAVLVLILLTVFLMQRNNRCRNSSPAGKAPRPPVPTHERDAYYYSNCQPQPQTVNPLLTSREKLPKTPTPSVDMTCSEFSSISRTHPSHHYYHHNHNNMNYGY